MGRRKHGTPDKFQWSGFVIDEKPADEGSIVTAVRRFVELFVIKNRRERVQFGLLHTNPNRRSETIQGVFRWIDEKFTTRLEGNSGFPQHLHARFGDLRGILVDEHCARHVTVAGAAILEAGQFGAVFIADAKPIALILEENGDPLLCERPR